MSIVNTAVAMERLIKQAVAATQFGQTQRYHTEVMLRTQDVGQHSFNVAWFCYILTGGAPTAALLIQALAHDAGERRTGDVPAPTKLALRLNSMLDEAERAHLVAHHFDLGAHPLTEEEAATLKLADSLEGGFYCLREALLGNRMVLSREYNGCARTYLEYIERLIKATDVGGLRTRALTLFNHLKREFDELSK